MAPPSAAFQVPANPAVTLIRQSTAAREHRWDCPLFDAPSGLWKLTGVAGSGVSSLIMDLVAHRIRQGESPESILVLAASKEQQSRLRRGIADRLASAGAPGGKFVSASTLVRSVHSLAFALLRRLEDQEIKLITGAEQDAIIRDLLVGQVQAAAEDPQALEQWPVWVRESVPMVGFARALRDLLLRAAERGLGPEDLEALGIRHDRPMWQAAGVFFREYEQTLSLGGVQGLSASELVSRVLEYPLPATPWRTVIVDDAQQLDPKSAELVLELMRQADLGIMAGDPEQSVFQFRGAQPEFFAHLPADHAWHLEQTHREPKRAKYLAPSVAEQETVVADLMRRTHLLHGVPWRRMAVIVRNAGMIDPIRRALLAAGVPVNVDATNLVLSEQSIVAAMLTTLRGVHEPLSPSELERLACGPIGGADAITYRRLLRGLRQVELRRAGARRAIELFTMLVVPEPVLVAQMQQLSGVLRKQNTERSDNPGEDASPEHSTAGARSRLVEERDALLAEAQEVLTERELQVLERIRGVFTAGARGGSVEEVLWNVWEATGLGEHLQAMSLRGGAVGSQADRDLDAIMALFDAAGDWVERRPTASVRSFLQHIEEQALPTGVRDRRQSPPDAVRVVTAHGAVGEQWHTVVVAGVQEGIWPTLSETGSIFQQQQLIDLLDRGIDPDVPIDRKRERRDEERRLLHLACSRATHQLLVTAVDREDDPQGEPSVFIKKLEYDEIRVSADDVAWALTAASPGEEAPGHDARADAPADPGDCSEPRHTTEATKPPLGDAPHQATGSALWSLVDVGDARVRLLSVPGMVAELRRALLHANAPQRHRDQAARQLARLARAGVPGAHPSQWWGTRQPSEQQPLTVRALSPSKVETGLQCVLRASLGAVADNETSTEAMSRGTVLHAYAEAVSRGVDQPWARQLVEAALHDLSASPHWRLQAQADADAETLDRFDAWLSVIRAKEQLLGVEVPVNVQLPSEVPIRGKIDRLSRVDDDLIVYDYKTGATPPTKEQAANNPQLLTYQLALRHGQINRGQIFATQDEGLVVDQALLVYPAAQRKTISVLAQSRAEDDVLEELQDQLTVLFEALHGPTLVATKNDHCQQCKLQQMCPVFASEEANA